ncbi:MAG: ABC transporter ATP-binding protein [Clostridia bacterium]|nr:ABC transporter ATP-binding protein [Clostridia bacterium]
MKRNSSQKGLIARILRLVLRQKGLIAASLLFSLGYVVLTLAVPVLTGNAIDRMIGAGQVDFAQIGKVLLQILLCVGAAALLQWGMNAVNNRISFAAVRDLRRAVFDHVTRLELRVLDAHPTGELLSRIVTDAEQLSDGLNMTLSQLFPGVVTLIASLVFMLTISPAITAVVFVLTPLSLLLARFVASRTFKMFSRQSEVRGQLTAYTNEMLSGLYTVKAFDREQQTAARFDEINRELEGVSLRATFFSSLTNPTTRFMYAVIYAVVAVIGCFSAVAGGITVGGLSAFLSYTNQYTKPFNEITAVITELQNAFASAARIFDLLDTPAIQEPTAQLPEARGAVEFENVAFSYHPEKPLLRDIDLKIQPGQRIAIVGPTGCGKTTLINLLMRFYDVDNGVIRVDGTDIRTVSRESLRRSFGMVLQDTWLRSGTIRENIAYGKPDATEQEIVAAAKAAHAHSFIRRLPDGYDTVLGEDGGSLSQGQKQLLCIARVMLCLPPILLLDEATSSIDAMTELRIQKAFDEMMRSRTSFVVAHRLSTIRNADVILVMQDGRIVEQGNHDTLLAQNGLYRELYQSQFATQEEL